MKIFITLFFSFIYLQTTTISQFTYFKGEVTIDQELITGYTILKTGQTLKAKGPRSLFCGTL